MGPAVAGQDGGFVVFGLGAPELVMILVIALIIFGPSKLPQIGASLGKGIRDFKAALNDMDAPPSRSLPDRDGPRAGSVPAGSVQASQGSADPAATPET